MERQFTGEQERAIALRDKNILVSAAAGSGKTAVLVERIIRMISEGEHPADIDRLLVVTFTSAAASEMRERITDAISEKLSAEPENEHLQRQSALIHNAQITTIHSFCLFVIRNHFQEIGLDPAFRVADEGEIGLLMQDVLEEVLEEAFAKLEEEKAERKRSGEASEGAAQEERAGEASEGAAQEERTEEAAEGAAQEKISVEESEGAGQEKTVKGAGQEAGGEDAGKYVSPFQALVEAYSTGKKETVLEESILSLYRFAMSYPWPEEWLKEHGEDYEFSSIEEMEQAPFMRYIMTYLGNILPEMAEELRRCVRICEKPDGPYMYGENLEKSLEALEAAARAETFSGCGEALERVEFERLSSKKDACVDPGKREMVKQARNGVKKQLEQLKEQFFLLGEEALLRQCRQVSPLVRELVELTALFGERFAAKKREKNMIDFSDMEHLTLSILCRRRENEEGVFVEPTAAALELRDYFCEIMIDEYQDSNLVQECILSCISGEDSGHFNRFMVGDVKQSIYKFRLARPELFMEKFYAYSGEEGERRLVNLRQNFRSRREVIDSVNLIFSQLLARNLGGIDYDENAMLYYGAKYYDDAVRERWDCDDVMQELRDYDDAVRVQSGAGDVVREGSDPDHAAKEREREASAAGNKITNDIKNKVSKKENKTELIIIERSEDTEKTAIEQEAEAIALRIRRLMREMQVLDKDSGCMRPLCYGDIVILLRSSSGIDEVFQEVLGRQDIPCFISSRTGYFQTSEVQVILQLLRTLDNPLQDIPMFGVLKSCFGSFTDVEAARLAAAVPGRQKLYKKMKRYVEEADPADALAVKCRRFLDWHTELRRCSVWLSIRELLSKIMEESHYLEYVAALPGGRQRRANAQMLLQKAAAFEKTSFKGLYHFIRYIDQIEKYSIDYGEAGTQDEAADVVRIMTIHKSKGLEFPVCIVAGMGKKMNRRDASSAVLMDMDIGIAVDLTDPVLRIRQRTLRKAALSRKILLDSQAEELRILYVALTRAKEKLIITGVTDDAARLLQGKSGILQHDKTVLPYLTRSSAGSFLELLVTCVMRMEGMEEVFQRCQIDAEAPKVPLKDDIICRIVENTGLQTDLLQEDYRVLNDAESFKMNLNTCDIDKKLQEYLQNRFGFRYPHENLQKLYAKTTVSELKMAAIHNMAGDPAGELPGEEADNGKHLFEEEVPAPYLPLFLRRQDEEEKISGTTRGSAMHRVMELMDFGNLPDAGADEPEETEASGKTKISGTEGGAEKERAISEEAREWKEIGRYDMAWLGRKIEDWYAAGLLSGEYKAAASGKKILRFMNSPLAERMHRAAKAGKLWKEQPFMLGISAARLSEEFPETEQVLVQGIIDVFFEEDGEIVLLDYKTDVINSPQELADRYRVQLDYYGEALERMTGKRVKERILYSFYFGEEVRVSGK